MSLRARRMTALSRLARDLVQADELFRGGHGRRLDVGFTGSQIGHMAANAESHGSDFVSFDKITKID